MSTETHQRRAISETSEEKFSFTEWFKNQKDATGYSVPELADILHTARRTIQDWLYVGKVPCEERQTEVRRVLLSKGLPPSKSVQAKMKRLHGLTWEASKNRWRYRYTIILNKKKVGVRKTINLKGLTVEEAVIAKDAALRTLKSLKLQIYGLENNL